jgi:hypothetical protein
MANSTGIKKGILLQIGIISLFVMYLINFIILYILGGEGGIPHRAGLALVLATGDYQNSLRILTFNHKIKPGH